MAQVKLDPHFDRFVEAQVSSGRFRDASEVVQAGLRLLEQEDAMEDAQLARAIRDAFDEPGADIPAEDVFAAIERRFAEDTKSNRGA